MTPKATTQDRPEDRLYHSLRQGIRSGTLAAGTRLSPVRQLAAQFGLSVSKAQRVCRRLARERLVRSRRGDGTYVADSVVSVAASMLPRAAVGTRPGVTVFLSEFSYRQFTEPTIGDGTGGPEFLRGLEEILGPGSFEVLPSERADSFSWPRGTEDGRRVFVTYQSEDAALATLLNDAALGGHGVVLVEDDLGHEQPAIHVRVDAVTGVNRALDLLWDLGHRRLAMLSWELPQPRDAGWIEERENAFRRRLESVGTPIEPVRAEFLANHERPMRDVSRVLDDLLSSPDRPTAVVCVNDILALALLDVCAERGIAVPDMLSVTGFDDAAGALARGLTTINRHYRDLGRAAGSAVQLSQRVRWASAGEIRIEPEVVVRRSAGPAPSA